MSAEIMNAFADLMKHFVSTNYITFEDNKLNILIYSLMSILISYILKFFINYNDFKDQINYFKWYVNYNIFRRTHLVYLCNKLNTPYSPDKNLINYNELHNFELQNENWTYFQYLISLKLSKNRSGGKYDTIFAYSYNFCLNLSNNTKTTDKYGNSISNSISNSNENTISTKPFMINSKSFQNYFISVGKEKDKDTLQDFKIIAFINGYYIFVNRDCFETDSCATIKCSNKAALDLFMSLIQHDFDENKSYFKGSSDKLKVVEYDGKNSIIEVGFVKPNLTFEHYVSRHKKSILDKLNSFKEGLLYKNNPYFENNLGMMLHGYYGSGKTFLISAIANYTKRNIYSINLAKIQTISAWRKIMSPSNLEKYVFAIDEMDYVLGELLLEENKSGSGVSGSSGSSGSDEVKLKIQMLSVQISTTDDVKMKELLVNEMKLLMETNTSNDKLTYQFLLGELSGLLSTQNRILIATTNFPDKIPGALKRPGRFDILLELGKFNNDEIKELLIKLYNPNKEELLLINRTKFPDGKYTPAELIMKASEHKILRDLIKTI